MAAYFDKDWFETQMSRVGVTMADLAENLNLSHESLRAMFLGKRRISDGEFGVLANMLHVPEADVRKRAGHQTVDTYQQSGARYRGSYETGYATEDPHLNAKLRELDDRTSRTLLLLERLARHLGLPDQY